MKLDLDGFYKDVSDYVRKKHVEYVLTEQDRNPFAGMNDPVTLQIFEKHGMGFSVHPRLLSFHGNRSATIYYEINARYKVGTGSTIILVFEIHPYAHS